MIVAYLSEEEEDGLDVCEAWHTGRFSAHVEGTDRDSAPQPLDGVPLDKAIAWAAEHAEVAIVRIGDHPTQYWTGARRPPQRWGFEPLPAGLPAPERRRPRGLAWCDRSDNDPAVPWPVEVSVAAAELPAKTTAKGVAAKASEHAAVVRARAARYGGPPPRRVAIRLVVSAPTRGAAEDTARTAVAETLGLASPRSIKAWAGPPELAEEDGGPDVFVLRRWQLEV